MVSWNVIKYFENINSLVIELYRNTDLKNSFNSLFHILFFWMITRCVEYKRINNFVKFCSINDAVQPSKYFDSRYNE